MRREGCTDRPLGLEPTLVLYSYIDFFVVMWRLEVQKGVLYACVHGGVFIYLRRTCETNRGIRRGDVRFVRIEYRTYRPVYLINRVYL